MAYIGGDTAEQLCKEMLENNAKIDEVIFALRAVWVSSISMFHFAV